jgi:hypothetical protein
MQSMVGTLVIAQEGRFQLLDLDGVGHLFLLHYGSAVEPDQLPSLLHRPIRVFYRQTAAKNIIGRTAVSIDLLEG